MASLPPDGSSRVQLRLVRFLFLPMVVLAVGVLAYFTFRTTFQIERLRQQSILESTYGLASEKADRLDKRLVEEDNAAIAIADPTQLEELSSRWLPTAARETPTIRAILILSDMHDVLAFGSRAGGGWTEEETFRRLLLHRMLDDMKLSEPVEELRHLHKEYDGQSYLISYWQREVNGRRFLMIAWHDLGRIVKYVFPQLYGEVGAGPQSRVNVIDQEGRIIYGPTVRTGQFTVGVPFPTTIYNWRLQISPVSGEELATRVRLRRLLELIVFVVSFIVILVAVIATLVAAERQRRISRLKSEFVANVSHELKTPLALIRMFGEMLYTGRVASDEKRKEYLEIIVNESERLTALIENVLDFARLERGRSAYEMKPGDVAEAVRKAGNVYRYRAEREHVELRVEAPETLAHPSIDERALQLAVINLIDNALKYAVAAEHDKSIVITASTADAHVRITVSDTGPGIPVADRARIFERFERGSNEADSHTRGSGIGLSLVKQVVESHFGRVWVEDARETSPKGSRFVIEIPNVPPRKAKP